MFVADRLRWEVLLLPIRILHKSGYLDEFHNWSVKDLMQVSFDAA